MPLFDGSRPGPGRPKGSLTRWSRAALDSVGVVFRKLGGVEAMTEWAREHPTDFYRGIYARLLPSQHQSDQRHTASLEPMLMSDADLIRIIERATRTDALRWDQQHAEAAALTGPVAESAPVSVSVENQCAPHPPGTLAGKTVL
jgi:hypothetical protein